VQGACVQDWAHLENFTAKLGIFKKNPYRAGVFLVNDTCTRCSNTFIDTAEKSYPRLASKSRGTSYHAYKEIGLGSLNTCRGWGGSGWVRRMIRSH
jgi:hypothetical protein